MNTCIYNTNTLTNTQTQTHTHTFAHLGVPDESLWIDDEADDGFSRLVK